MRCKSGGLGGVSIEGGPAAVHEKEIKHISIISLGEFEIIFAGLMGSFCRLSR